MYDISDFIDKKTKERNIIKAKASMEVRAEADRDLKDKISASITLDRDYVVYDANHKYIDHMLLVAKKNGWFVVPVPVCDGSRILRYKAYFKNGGDVKKRMRNDRIDKELRDTGDSLLVSGMMCAVIFLISFIISKCV